MGTRFGEMSNECSVSYVFRKIYKAYYDINVKGDITYG